MFWYTLEWRCNNNLNPKEICVVSVIHSKELCSLNTHETWGEDILKKYTKQPH
jgi:hypothetical protein